MRKITYQQAREALIEAVTANPDRQVAECSYVDENGCPNCVIGVAMNVLGIPLPKYSEPVNTTPIKHFLMDSFLLAHEIQISSEAGSLWNEAQKIQDRSIAGAEIETDANHPGQPWHQILSELDLDNESESE